MKSLIVDVNINEKCVLSRAIVVVDEASTFIEILDTVKNDYKNVTINGELTSVFISTINSKLDKCVVKPDLKLSETLTLFDVKYVDYHHRKEEASTSAACQDKGITFNASNAPNAFNAIMSPKPRKLQLSSGGCTMHNKVYDDCVDYFQRKEGLVKRGYSVAAAGKTFRKLTDILYYLDGQHPKINDAAHRKGFKKIPDM